MSNTRREFFKRSGEGAVALSVLGAFGFAPGSASAATPADLRAAAAYAVALGIPLTTTDPSAWESDLESRLPAAAASRAQSTTVSVGDAGAAAKLSPTSAYEASTRFNAFLQSRPEAQPLVAAALTAIVDPNGFVDTATLARGNFPTGPDQPLPRLQPFPLG
jgi:hypothetical protein